MRKHIARPEEEAIFSACQREDFAQAATLALDCYGNEILGFIRAYLENKSNVDDVFSIFLEDFWVGLPRFEWRCSMRAWAYTLARHAAIRYMISPEQRPRHHLPLAEISEVADMENESRNTIPNWMQSGTREKIHALRRSLLPDDQAVLILRVDRGLSWRELVSVMTGPDHSFGEQELELEIQKYRKRFERIKAKLKRLAEREGLLEKQMKD